MKKNKKSGFTLAETLITLAIIGVVAALTIPTLMSKYQKKTTAKKVAKFYSTMHNAIDLVNAEQGNTHWFDDYIILPNKDIKEFYGKYLNEKLKSVKKTEGSWHMMDLIIFPDGSGFTPWFIGNSNLAFTYCVNAKHCKKYGVESYDGKNGFLFLYDKTKGFVPYCDTNRSRDSLLKDCKVKNLKDNNKSHCCSALLMQDNWEIKDDYPWNW